MAIFASATMMISFIYRDSHVTLESVRAEILSVESGYLCVFPVSKVLRKQIIASLPDTEMQSQKLKLDKCDKHYTNCCNQYIDGAWAYAVVDEDKTSCTVVSSADMSLNNESEICIQADNLMIRENPVGRFAITSKDAKP